MASTGYESSDGPRSRKFSAVEDHNGNIVELGELNSQDQELAQFGYKPVCRPLSLQPPFTALWLQARTKKWDAEFLHPSNTPPGEFAAYLRHHRICDNDLLRLDSTHPAISPIRIQQSQHLNNLCSIRSIQLQS